MQLYSFHFFNVFVLTDIKPTLTVQPQSSVFTGDRVILNCDVDQSTGWEFTFINSTHHEHFQASRTKTISSVHVSDAGEYKCRARRGEKQQNYTQYSDPITVTVEGEYLYSHNTLI